jgi:hypothetical protein
MFGTAESKLRRQLSPFYQKRPIALAAFRPIGIGRRHFLCASGI